RTRRGVHRHARRCPAGPAPLPRCHRSRHPARPPAHPHRDRPREGGGRMTRRILVVIGTPLPTTLTHALAAAYVASARRAGAEVRVIDLAVDPIPDHPRSRAELRAPRDTADRPLDPVVGRYLDDVLWADHL